MDWTDEERAAWLAARRRGDSGEDAFDTYDNDDHDEAEGDDDDVTPLRDECLNCGAPVTSANGSVTAEGSICDRCL